MLRNVDHENFLKLIFDLTTSSSAICASLRQLGVPIMCVSVCKVSRLKKVSFNFNNTIKYRYFFSLSLSLLRFTVVAHFLLCILFFGIIFLCLCSVAGVGIERIEKEKRWREKPDKSRNIYSVEKLERASRRVWRLPS